MPQSSKTKQFVKYITDDLQQHGWKIIFSKSLKGCRGYCDEEKKIIAVEKTKNWEEILAHEYAHFIQYKNKYKTYSRYYSEKFDPETVIKKYLSGEINYNKRVKKSFEIVRNNELYCDIIALRLMDKFKLKIDKVSYIKSVNIHMIYYHYLEKSQNAKHSFRLFYNTQSYNYVPDIIKKSYVFNVPDNVYQKVIGTV